MDAVTGGLLAAAAAWLSILAVVVLPPGRRAPDPAQVRRLGAGTIALFALQALGLPVPLWVPLAVFLVGLVALMALAPPTATGEA